MCEVRVRYSVIADLCEPFASQKVLFCGQVRYLMIPDPLCVWQPLFFFLFLFLATAAQVHISILERLLRFLERTPDGSFTEGPSSPGLARIARMLVKLYTVSASSPPWLDVTPSTHARPDDPGNLTLPCPGQELTSRGRRRLEPQGPRRGQDRHAGMMRDSAVKRKDARCRVLHGQLRREPARTGIQLPCGAAGPSGETGGSFQCAFQCAGRSFH